MTRRTALSDRRGVLRHTSTRRRNHTLASACKTMTVSSRPPMPYVVRAAISCASTNRWAPSACCLRLLIQHGNCSTYNVTVPINARATVYIAAVSKESVREAGAALTSDVRFLRMANSTGTPRVPLALFQVSSGDYSFSSHY